jgi:D-ribose pyranase
MTGKMRLLHPRLAALCATLRHGEMIYVADAGSGTHAKSLVPLSQDVEYIDLGVVTGVPAVADLLPVLCDAGDFEAAIITEDMPLANPEGQRLVESLFGAGHVHTMRYLPDFYKLRDRAKAVVQTGDYRVHANVILVAGYPSPPIPVHWLTSSRWFDEVGRSNGSEQAQV